MVVVTHGPNEQRYATDRWARHQPDCLTDIKWGLADTDEANPPLTTVRWHASTLVPLSQIPTPIAHRRGWFLPALNLHRFLEPEAEKLRFVHQP